MLRVAIIGGGAAGIGAAVALVRRGAAVELFEAEPALGGHCYGVTIPFDGERTFRIDAGVSDFNEASFSEVTALVRELGLEYFPVCQDASFMTEARQTLWFAQAGHFHFSPQFPDHAGFVAEAERFNRDCIEVVEDASYADWSAERYLSVRGYSDTFRKYYFAPRAQGCFPMPNRSPYRYMIRSIVAFWRMHGIVGSGPARRMVVKGGMHTYAQAVQTWLTSRKATVHLSSHVVGITRREGTGVRVRYVNRERANMTQTFDQVVIATNANQVIPLLEDPAPEEQRIFASFEWQRARIAVHQDAALMPADRSTWGAYNYIVDYEPEIRPTITFYPNRLARFEADVPDVFVTMNPFREPAPEKLIADRFFVHPSVGGIRDLAVERLDTIQGERGTWFCGGYLHEPFVHEQALRSGLEIGDRLVSRMTATPASPLTRGTATGEQFSDFLNRVNLFSGLDPLALAELQLIAQHFSVEVGQTIFRQGDQADGLYVIKNGAVAVVRRMPGDEFLRLATLGPGDVVGEAGLLDSGVRSASAVSIEPTDGFFVSAERFRTLRADMRPAALLVMHRFTREVADRTRKAVDNIVTAKSRCNAAATDWPALPPTERLALDVLAALPMLRKFKPSEIEQLSERLPWVRLARSAVVARAGDRAERCLIVLRGACMTTLPMSYGDEPFSIHGPGSLVGELPLVDGGAHFGDCIAREETIALVIGQSAFHELCRGQTTVEFKLFEAMTLGIVAQLRRANGIAARLALGHRAQGELHGR